MARAIDWPRVTSIVGLKSNAWPREFMVSAMDFLSSHSAEVRLGYRADGRPQWRVTVKRPGREKISGSGYTSSCALAEAVLKTHDAISEDSQRLDTEESESQCDNLDEQEDIASLRESIATLDKTLNMTRHPLELLNSLLADIARELKSEYRVLQK